MTYRPPTHPFQGATLAVDPDSEAARYQRLDGAGWLQPIAEQPQARWINSLRTWTPCRNWSALALSAA